MSTTETQPQDPPANSPGKPYTALIYFHGMGSQRRFEEPSYLIDSIDLFLANAWWQRQEKRGILYKIVPKAEANRVTGKGVIDYIRTRHVIPGQEETDREVRVYESYWAPIMAKAGSPWAVAKWVLWQALRPFQTGYTPWRERQRLRRAELAQLYEAREAWPEGVAEEDFGKLLRCYGDFNGLPVKRNNRVDGTYKAFHNFIGSEEQYGGQDEVRARLQSLAECWRIRYNATERRNGFLIATLLLAMALAFGGLVWSVVEILGMLQGWLTAHRASQSILDLFKDRLEPTAANAAALVLSLLVLLGLGRFLVRSLGDVQAWAALEETDEMNPLRQKVLSHSMEVIEHVLKDEKCLRAIVVSHSLGTSVAHDTLLALGTANRAFNPSNPIAGPVPLDKIRHFVTMGSPVDKIHYFFESRRSRSHRYLRVLETLRGDISREPFSKNGKPHIHWVNYWDEADPVSGPLNSPAGEESFDHLVDNVRIAGLYFPEPAAAHMAYIQNRRVVSDIFQMAYHDEGDYGTLVYQPGQRGLDYASMAQGPGDAAGAYRGWLRLAFVLPWLALIALLLGWAGFGLPRGVAFGLVGAGVVALAVGWAANRKRGNRLPL